ncbi:MAG: HMA2 domain-containing protein [Syntrophobacteraceae bacterium]
MDCYCHITPGRLRVKSPKIRQNEVQAQRIRAVLGAIPGIETVFVNIHTGSITIFHTGSATDAEKIVTVLKEQGYLTVPKTCDRSMESVISRIGAAAGKVLVGAVVGKALEGSMLSFLAYLV